MRIALCAIALLSVVPVAAQEPDTTDWHRYVPLAVGNAWQHRVDRGTLPYPIETTFEVAEVVGTTEVDGQTYFEVVECSRAEGDPTPCSTNGPRTLVRYDEETASVAERVEIDGDVVHRPWGYYPCNLNAPEGEIEMVCPDGAMGNWFVSIEPYEEATLLDGTLSGPGAYKTYGTLVSGMLLQTDAGLVSAGFGDPECSVCIALVYARLDGVEYGEPVVTVGAEEDTVRDAPALAVFPNPLRNAATLRFGLDAPVRLTLEVYDVRGRRVRALDLGARAAGAHVLRFGVGDLPAGAYRLRLRGDGGFEAARGVIVLR